MWKLLIVISLVQVNAVPTQYGPRAGDWLYGLQSEEKTCRCPLSSTSSNRIESPIDTNRQPIPFDIKNTGANFYQNFVFNGVLPSGSNNFGPPQVPKRDDYTYTPGVGAHKLYRKLLTWNAARKACNEDGGHLAIINSDEEARVLTEMLRNSDPVIGATYDNEVYLGIHDLYGEGDWVTIFGETLANAGYEKWSQRLTGNQPNNLENRQHCGSLMKDEGFNDVACSDVLPYFCELTNV